MKIYLAHPMTGVSSDNVFGYYDSLAERLSKHIILTPVTGKDYLRNVGALQKTYDTPLSNEHAIYNRDTWMVSQADIVLCDLTGANKVSIGCCFELACAGCYKKHVIVVMDENNVHDHPFVRQAADIVYKSIDEAVAYINLLP